MVELSNQARLGGNWRRACGSIGNIPILALRWAWDQAKAPQWDGWLSGIAALVLVAGGAALALAGWVQSEMIVLKNTSTGEIEECRKNSGPSFFPIAQIMIDKSATPSCAAGYQAAGYIRMN
jgi:hypothetical protein